MKYLLFRQGDEAATPVLAGQFESEFAAADWARSWLQGHAQHDRYVLKREDNARSVLVIRTVAGQWYYMPQGDPVG